MKNLDVFVSLTDGVFTLETLYRAMKTNTKNEKANVRQCVHRLKTAGIIEKYGKVQGVYRKISPIITEWTQTEPINLNGKIEIVCPCCRSIINIKDKIMAIL